MKKIYIDIDGVILTKHNTRIADNSIDFMTFITKNFDCYWLTTHCRDGQTRNLIRMLSLYFPENIIEIIKQVKPTKWDALKTEAIDFKSDFLWVDDYVFESEKTILIHHNCLDRLILVDLEKDGNLLVTLNILKQAM